MTQHNIPLTMNIKGKLIDLTSPIIMGIVNCTPDSFYALSRINTEVALIKHIQTSLLQGATIIDIGAYSSRPDAEHISEKEEIKRLNETLSCIKNHFPTIILSVDTFRASVAEHVIKEFEIDIINDIGGGTLDAAMFDTIAKWNVGYVLNHIQGTPQTMQKNPQYENFIPEMLYYFSEKLDQLKQRGIKDIIIDPGFGFGKTLEQNYAIINHFNVLHEFELPILVGISRKSMIQKLLQVSPEESLNGTTALHTLLVEKGAHILRVHDIKEAKQVITIINQLNSLPYDI